MKKFTTVLCLCILIVVFVFMFVFSTFLPRTTESNYDVLKAKPVFSLNSLLSGEYLSSLKDYFTDTIYLRDDFVDFEARIRALYGLNTDNEQLIETKPNEDDEEDISSDSSVLDTESNDDSSEQDNMSDIESSSEPDISIESSEEPQISDTETSNESSEDISDEVSNVVEKFEVEEIESRLIILGTRIFEIYGGDRENSDGTFDIEIYAETLNAFAEKVGNDVNVYSMVIPKACAYYLQQADSDKYNKYLNKDRDDINRISDLLSENVTDVNIYNTLGRHANEDIYFRTDHHWTALGAYYACELFAEKAGTVIDDISNFEVEEREGFLGSLYGSSNGSTALLNNPEVFKIYYPDTDYSLTYYDSKSFVNPREHEEGFFWQKADSYTSNWYSTFINGDAYSIRAVSNECKNGRKLLIVKDSYGNALAPFLIEGFEEIYIIDARNYEVTLSETIEQFGITDVLFTECTFSAASAGYVNNLKELCK